jgi:hypothetical protein
MSAVSNIDRHLTHSKALDLTGIDFDDVPNHPLRDDEIRILTYFMDVESNTIVYLKELLSTPAIDVPEIQAFLSCWVYEEYFHGHAIRKFLGAYGVGVGEERVVEVKRSKSLVFRLRTLGQTLLARWAGPRFIGVHMAWGAANELATAEGYQRIVSKSGHPILVELLTRIMKDERRHFAFYYKEALDRMKDPKTAKLVSTLIRRFFEPVGADIRSLEEVDAVGLMLFDDEEGMAIVRRIDEKIAALPGLAGWRGYETCMARSRARFGRSLGVIGQGQFVAPRLA